jgi:hypothetical protein
MQMPGRGFNSSKYRYGFNGQEKSSEIAEEGNLNTALFWEYDTRIGRRWNLDPKPRIDESQYSVFSNSPILLSDPLGDTSSPVTRIFGALKAVGGVGEMTLGALGGGATSWTGIGAVLGALAVAHGADGASHGLTELITGEEAPTYTAQGISKGLQYTGVSKDNANLAGNYGDMAIGLALTVGTSAVKDGTFLVRRPDKAPVAWMGGSTVIGSDAATTANASRMVPEKGIHQVLVHGTPDGFIINGSLTSPKELARQLLTLGGYQRGTTIRLISCETGAFIDGAAYQLSRYVRAPVIAPTGRVAVTQGGGYIIEGAGKFKTFFNTGITL